LLLISFALIFNKNGQRISGINKFKVNPSNGHRGFMCCISVIPSPERFRGRHSVPVSPYLLCMGLLNNELFGLV